MSSLSGSAHVSADHLPFNSDTGRKSSGIEPAFDTLKYEHEGSVALQRPSRNRHAVRRNLDESIEELRQIADGRNDILAEAAGITAGFWYAWPSTHIGHELVAAGMLILAGNGRGMPFDYDELERWTRVGFERGTRSRHGER